MIRHRSVELQTMKHEIYSMHTCFELLELQRKLRGHVMKLWTLIVFAIFTVSRHGAFGEKRVQQHSPIKVLEVSRPPDVAPESTEICKQVLVHHVFGNTVDEAPVVRRYEPRCEQSKLRWSRVLLRWTASSTGRQFDRISAVWLGGVEILRTCTAEPVKQPGIEWTIEKDVTRYSSLWTRPQLLTFKLANVVSLADSLTGLYDVTLSVHFCSDTTSTDHEGQRISTRAETKFKGRFGANIADVILPLERSSSSSPDDLWFRIQGEGDVQTRWVHAMPRNAYRAALEVCVSFHERDEFWYANRPNEYSASNNLTGDFENGPFREILVTIDDDVVPAGVVHPFPVIYTGGVNPFFWRPVTAIGSFVIPSYHVDVTPFLARLVDGNAHSFKVSVTNALPFWLLGLNLHIWVDANSRSTTRGAVTRHSTSTSTANSLNFLALDGTFLLKTSRALSHSGWLLSSLGNLTTAVEFSAHFSHSMTLTDSANALQIHQDSVTERTVTVSSEERSLIHHHELYRFPLRLSMHQFACEEGTIVQKAAIDHAWEEERQYYNHHLSEPRAAGDGYGGPSFFSTLKNRQQSQGTLIVPQEGENHGVATMKQSLSYDGSAGCYSRSLGVALNGSYLFDHSHTRCT